MKLYTYFRSSAAYRVRIALNVKGLAHDQIPIHFLKNGGEHRQPAYLAVNPQGLIPALEDHGQVIGQSMAIIEYLDEAYPETPRLLPADPMARAQVRALTLGIACDIHPLNNLRVLNYLKGPLGHDQDTVNRWYAHWINEGFRSLEENIRRHGSKHHAFGDSLTMADVFLVPQVYNARRFNVDTTAFPNITRIADHLLTLPPFTAAAPHLQPDAE